MLPEPKSYPLSLISCNPVKRRGNGNWNMEILSWILSPKTGGYLVLVPGTPLCRNPWMPLEALVVQQYAGKKMWNSTVQWQKVKEKLYFSNWMCLNSFCLVSLWFPRISRRCSHLEKLPTLTEGFFPSSTADHTSTHLYMWVKTTRQ